MDDGNCKKVIAVTRPFDRISEAVSLVEENGAEAFVAPTLELRLLNTPSLKKLMDNASDLDWLIFTSATSIDSIFHFYPDFLDELNSKCKIAVIGHKTAEVAIDNQLPVDIVPDNYTAEGLLECFGTMDMTGLNVGIPRTFSARKVLPDTLESMGANVMLAESYKSILPEDTVRIELLISKILNDEVDAVTFTSPLTVNNLFEVATDDEQVKLSAKMSTDVLTVCIGPITYNILDKFNVKCVYPETYTVKDMMELLFEKL
jgi:uroporphyrinogen-III synthase